jgi:uncharacterized protein (DUF58 family)
MKEVRLNVDIPEAITEFLAVMKEFRLRGDIYRILFRGKGLEFEAYRDFSPDDDASDIDWKASNRAQKLLVKQYKEERDLKIMFIIDVGDNMVFGSGNKLKCEYATELVAAFSKLIMTANDRVGFILYSDKVKQYVKPSRGDKHFMFFMDNLTYPKTYGGVSDVDNAIDFALNYFPNNINSVIFVSDFLRVSRDTEKKLELLAHKFETVLIRVRDLLDMTLPEINGEVIVQNSEGSGQVIVNPKVVRASYEKYALEQARVVEEIFKKTEADYLDLVTNKPFPVPLAIFLKERIDRRGM